ncbi:MAG: rod-binding protein [bacterium]
MDIHAYSQLGNQSRQDALLESARNQQVNSDDEDNFGMKLEQKLGRSPEEKDKRLKELAEDMEGMFLNMLVKEMRKTVPKDGGLIDGGQAEEIWQQQLDSRYSDVMAQNHEIGIAEAIYEQMSAKV